MQEAIEIDLRAKRAAMFIESMNKMKYPHGYITHLPKPEITEPNKDISSYCK